MVLMILLNLSLKEPKFEIRNRNSNVTLLYKRGKLNSCKDHELNIFMQC